MKTKDKAAKDKPDTADHVLPPELDLQVCPKCQANYNRASLTHCPKCQEPRPEMPPAVEEVKGHAIDQEPAKVEVVPEFPYLGQPSEQGGVIIEVIGGKVVRDMTEADVAEAAEEIGKVSVQHGEVSIFLRSAEGEVADLEQHLKEQRSIVRNAEIRLLDVGAELAVLGRAVNSGKREWKTQITHTVTPGNELVQTDAKTGKQVGERRTATADEMKKATNRQAALLNPDAPKDLAHPIDDAKAKKDKKRKTSDSPSHKPDPGEQMLKVSVSSSAFNRLTAQRKDNMRKMPGSDDEPGFALNWSLTDDGERMNVEIPRRLLLTLTTIAGPSLDFKQDSGVVLEIE